MEKIFLEPINGRKSFYKKCYMIKEGDITKLYSYNMLVAEYNTINNEMKIHGWYSNTTGQHINAFLKYYNFDTCTKKELEKFYLSKNQ